MQPLFGVTHDAKTGQELLRIPRLLKLGIGVPRGPAIHTWIQPSEDGKTLQWVYRAGQMKDGKLDWFIAKSRVPILDAHGNSNRAQAESVYWEMLGKVPEAKYPQKLPYFTFTRPVLREKTELYEPDFEAIERHGATPTSVDIVLMTDEPFSAEYAMWSSSELKCHGDGVNALRVVSMAPNPKEWVGKYFPIENGCATQGCPYFQEQDGKPAPCKPSGDLNFHLINDIRIGGTSYFHTTGYRSIAYLYSGLQEIKTLTGGRLRGIPVRLSLKAYKTKHNGQVATQYGVWLEFRAENVAALRKNLIEAAMQFRAPMVEATPKQIEAPTVETGAEEDDGDVIVHTAQAMTDEFYPEAADEGPAEKTEAKGKALKEELRQELKEEPTPKPSPVEDLKAKMQAEARKASAPKKDLF